MTKMNLPEGVNAVNYRDWLYDRGEFAPMGVWDQESITQWGDDTFGEKKGGSREIAVRCNKEMAELLSCLEHGELEKALEEAADVLVVLFQVAEYIGRERGERADLIAEVKKKMSVNVNRKWGKAADGSFQHVD